MDPVRDFSIHKAGTFSNVHKTGDIQGRDCPQKVQYSSLKSGRPLSLVLVYIASQVHKVRKSSSKKPSYELNSNSIKWYLSLA